MRAPSARSSMEAFMIRMRTALLSLSTAVIIAACSGSDANLGDGQQSATGNSGGSAGDAGDAEGRIRRECWLSREHRGGRNLQQRPGYRMCDRFWWDGHRRSIGRRELWRRDLPDRSEVLLGSRTQRDLHAYLHEWTMPGRRVQSLR